MMSKQEEKQVKAPKADDKIEYEKPKLELESLEKAAKAFAVKSGMGSC